MNKVLVELDSICYNCENGVICVECRKNEKYGYSIYSNFTEYRYIQQKDKELENIVMRGKENISYYYNISEKIDNKIVCIPYEKIMKEYNREKSVGKRFR